MIPGAPREARWIRSEPRRSLPATDLDRLLRHALGDCTVAEVQPLTAGFRNANFKVRLNTRVGWIVVRIYEHDASLCQKEIDLLRVVGVTVPVPQVIFAELAGLDGLPPFLLMQYVEGISFHDLKRQLLRQRSPLAKHRRQSAASRSQSQDGSLSGRLLPRRYWTARIPLCASSICVWHRRTCDAACPPSCAIASVLCCGQERRSLQNSTLRLVSSTATSVNTTWWCDATAADGQWPQFSIGSSQSPARRWPTSAIFSAMSALRNPAPNLTSRLDICMPAEHYGRTGDTLRGWSISPRYARA